MWNWRPVADLFPGRAGVSDIDGVIERNGHFLFIECKHYNEGISTGQLTMLKSLAGLSSARVRVVVVYGDRESGLIGSYQRVTRAGLQDIQPGGAFMDKADAWFKRVTQDKRYRR